MSSKSPEQQRFFGAVMGAKEGQKGVKGAAKKVANKMSKKTIKKFLKKESYDDVVNSYLKKYLLEMDVRRSPEEQDGAIIDIPDIDDYSPLEVSPEEMREIVKREVGEEQFSMMSDDEIEQYYNDVVQLSPEENIPQREMYIVVSQAIGEEKASKMSPEEIKQAYYNIENNPSMGEDEDYEEEDCESAHQGCTCDGCSQCMANREQASGGGDDQMLNFYYPKKAI